MKLFGIALVFLAFVFGGAALARKYISVLEGVERAEKLVAAFADGVRREHGTMEEILRSVLETDDKTDYFINDVLKNSAGKRIVLKKGTAAETGFCSHSISSARRTPRSRLCTLSTYGAAFVKGMSSLRNPHMSGQSLPAPSA